MSVSFGQAIRLGFKNYFNFTGVARRSEYWWFYLFTFLVGGIASILDAVFGLTSKFGDNGPLYYIALIALFVPSTSIYVRRLRDSGRYWANIFWNLVPLAGIIIWIYQLTQPTQHLARETYGYTSIN